MKYFYITAKDQQSRIVVLSILDKGEPCMTNHLPNTKLSIFLAISLGVLFVYSLGNSPAVKAENLEFVRTIDTDDLFNREFYKVSNTNLLGIGFPPGAQTLLFLNHAGGARLDLMTPPTDMNSKIQRTSVDIVDPINIAFDMKSRGARGFNLFRLFIWDFSLGQLICIKSGPRNIIKPGSRSDVDLSKKVDFQRVGVTNPQGMTLDPATGILYLLNASTQQIISIKRKMGGSCDGVEISQVVDIPFSIKGQLRGLAFNPSDKHLYVMNSRKQKLYKLALNGKLITSIDLSGQNIGLPQGMIFGPSLDRTDHVSIFHLYLVTTLKSQSEFTEWALK